MKSPVVLLALAFSVTAPLGARAEAQAQDWALTSEWVQRFELSLDLNDALENDGAYQSRLSLASYARYYDTGSIDGETFVRALYVSERPHGRNVYIGEPAPMVFDGGCSVVTLRIEPGTLRVTSAHCNGLA